jgi:hypothetical protein
MVPTPHSRIPGSPESSSPWIPETEAERTAIREQLAKILESPLLSNSKRCARLLQYTVERTLSDPAEHLKERTLGIEVFQREPDYDTNRDPVVRTTAVEIRKRIAQYYQQPGREGEIRISLPPGSYVPEFRMPAGWNPSSALETPPAQTPPARPAGAGVVGRPVAAFWLGVAAAALLAAAIWLRPWAAPTALERFWAPVFSAPGPVLLVIGGGKVVGGSAAVGEAGVPAPAAPGTKTIIDLQREEKVAFADATTLSRITGVMMSNRKLFHIRQHKAAKLDDLREGPVVLIGAFNNEWTLRLEGQTRFFFERDSETKDSWIADRETPGQRKWLVHETAPYTSLPEDYALISRVIDPTTGRLVVTAAGITKFGTAAAGEFLSDPSYMDNALRSAPGGWDRKNIQILLSTKIVGESSGPPRVLATHFW